MDPIFYLYYIILGGCVGFIAGLLGVGGGAIMVPVLTSLFVAQGIAQEHVVHLALGTSLSSILLTSISSLMAHHRRDGVLWPQVRCITPGILIGSLLAMLILHFVQSIFLAAWFALFMVFVAFQILFGKAPRASKPLPSKTGLIAAGSVIGALSTLASIGGGSISVPYLLRHNVPLKKAIGTSAALGFPIALFGMTVYWVLGEFFSPSERGYIAFQAVIPISLMSIIFAPLGVRAAYKLPVNVLKKIFAALLIALSAKMFFSLVHF